MSDRFGNKTYDQWVKFVDDSLALLLRGDQLAGTVSVGRLLIGDGLYLDDIRKVPHQKNESLALVVTDKRTGTECVIPLPCMDADQPGAQGSPWSGVYSFPGVLASTENCPPLTPPAGTMLTSITANVDTSSPGDTHFIVTNNGIGIGTFILPGGQSQFIGLGLVHPVTFGPADQLQVFIGAIDDFASPAQNLSVQVWTCGNWDCTSIAGPSSGGAL